MQVGDTRSLIFDLDGTLCESTKCLLPEMQHMLKLLSQDYDIWVTTGTSHQKLLTQIPADVLSCLTGVYCSLGTEYYNNGQLVSRLDAEFSQSLLLELQAVFEACEFAHKHECAITYRNAMINFSVLTPGSSDTLRKQFATWDHETNFRNRIVMHLKNMYPQYNFAAGGMVSIDITQTGVDKSVIVDNEKLKTDVIFFGDKAEPLGNDYPVAQAIVERKIGKYYCVESPEHTLSLLKKIRA